MQSMAKVKGQVKWFSEAKGYGFITPADGSNKDVFFKLSDVVLTAGTGGLARGQSVEFSIVDGDKGAFAQDATPAVSSSSLLH